MLQKAPVARVPAAQPRRFAVLLSVLAGAVAATAPELALPVLAALACLRLLLAHPAWLAGAYVAAVYLRLPELATSTWGFPAISSQALTVVALSAGALRWVRLGRAPRALGPVVALLAASAAAVLLSSLGALDPEVSVIGAGALLADGTVAIAVVLLVRDRRDLVAALWGLVAAGFLVAVTGLLQQLTDTPFPLAGLAQTSASTLVGQTTGYRLGGQYGDANFFAQALLVVVPVALALAVLSRRPGPRALAASCVVAASAAVLLTYSRGGLLVLTLVAVACISRFPRVRRPAAALVLAAGVLLVALPWQPTGTLGDLVARASSSAEDPSVRQRTRGLETAAAMALAHPLIGVGHDNWPLRQAEFAPGAGLAEPRDPPLPPHSVYLQVAAETGAVGLAALLALVVVPVLGLRRRRPDDPRGALLAWAVTAGLLAHFTAAALLPRAYPRQTWLVVGLALAAGAVLSTAAGVPRPVTRPVMRRVP